MDPSIRKGIRKRSDWIRRNPGGAGDYIRLDKRSRERVDALFLEERRLKANEVSSLVDELTEERLRKKRTGNLRNKALANLRAQLSIREKFHDQRVAKNVGKMSQPQLKVAATADENRLVTLASAQYEGNPFFYH